MLGEFSKSPTGFSPMALFSGADHVAPAVAYMADHASEPAYSVARGTNDTQWCTDKYVVLMPPRIQEAGPIQLPSFERRALANFLREHPSLPQHAQRAQRSEGGLLSERKWPIWPFVALKDLVCSSPSHFLLAPTYPVFQTDIFPMLIFTCRLNRAVQTNCEGRPEGGGYEVVECKLFIFILRICIRNG